MSKQDRVLPRTPEAAVRASRAEILKLSDSITLSVENGDTTAHIKLKVGNKEIPATIELKGLVSFTNLKTPGATEIDGGNITTGTILADLIKAGVLKSKDGSSIIIDLEEGRADITGSVNLSGLNERGTLVGSLRPGILQIAQWGVPYPGAEAGLLSQVQIIESGLEFTDPVNGKTLELKLEDGKGRLSGLADPEEGGDAVSLSYLNRQLDALREELGLGVG